MTMGNEMDLGTLANLAEIFGFLIVIGGLAFAIVQILQYRRHRREMAAIELARSFESPSFGNALRLVLSLPDNLDAEGLRKHGSQYEDAAFLVSLTIEAVAIMVHRRIVDLDVVWELMGGVSQTAWKKLCGWAKDIRSEHGQEKFDEWFEWLAVQMRRYGESSGIEPAYRQYESWRP